MSNADTYLNAFGGLVTNSGHASDEMVIEISNVSKWYGDFQVLTDCTAHVHKGDVVVVCGPSGSGKSTLIKTVNGLEPFQKGEIMVNGISVGAPKTNLPKLRSRVGMVFQHFELFPHLTIIDNLTVAQIKVLGRKESEAKQKAMVYLDRVGLTVQAAKYPAELSGGQQQRVAIARALVRRPRVMLLDESFSSLDTATRIEVRAETVRLLREAEVATVMVTHDPVEADAVGDRVSWLDACCRGGGADPEACVRR